MKKSELRNIIKEELLKEGLTYPDQYEAEALVEWTNAVNSVYVGGAPLVREAFNKAEEIRIKMWDKIFGDKSPWTVKRKGKKLIVTWDNYKADKLGL